MMALLRSVILYFAVPTVFCVLVSSTGLLQTYFNESRIFSLPVVLTFALVVSGFVYLFKAAYKFLWTPWVFYGNEGWDSYFVDKGRAGMTRAETIAEMKRSRKIGDIPPVYPNGWFAVCRSNEVKKMETRYAHVLGLNLAVFRGESGRSYIVDAYCPHLGANLAVGGKVDGECIECPFHGWAYRGEDGKCVKIGYADKVPDFVAVSTYSSMEINDLILVWYHAEGEEPSWYPPEIKEVIPGDWVMDGVWEAYLDCHIQDIVENAGDLPHLNYVHGPQFYQKIYKSCWYPHPTHKHISITESTWGRSKVEVWTQEIHKAYHEQHGPGLAYVHINDSFLLTAVVPVGPLRQKVLFFQYAPKASSNVILRILRRLSLYFAYLTLKGDIFIWANKTYKANPQYITEDALIAKHRRWFTANFYSEHSPRYRPRDPLEW